jgi:hypothetical protein
MEGLDEGRRQGRLEGQSAVHLRRIVISMSANTPATLYDFTNKASKILPTEQTEKHGIA